MGVFHTGGGWTAETRERLSCPRPYHVSPSGSDAGDSLSLATAFLTVQRAVEAASEFDCAGQPVTI